jgi:hypothetical protein
VAEMERSLVWQYLTLYVQFCAPDDGRRNVLKHAKQFVEINKSSNVASCWLYFGSVLLAMHGHTKVRPQDNLRLFFWCKHYHQRAMTPATDMQILRRCDLERALGREIWCVKILYE